MKVVFLEDGARSEVPFSTGPDVSPRVQPSHHKTKPWLFCSSMLPFPPPPLWGRAKFFRAQNNLIAIKNVSQIFAFWHFSGVLSSSLLILGLDWSLWGQGPQVIYSSIYLFHTIHSPSLVWNLLNSLTGLLAGKDCVLFIFCISFAPNTMPGIDHTVNKSFLNCGENE